MTSEVVTITNRLGMHARPSALFVQTASRFASEVTVSKDGTDVNGKSVMGMMMLAAECGSALTLSVNGADVTAALSALKELFKRNFDED